MRYLTKEWYSLAHNREIDAGIRASKKAEVFDETYFRRLYTRIERNWVDLDRECANIPFDEIYPEKYDPSEFSDIDDTEGFCPMTEEEYAEIREQARAAFDASRVEFSEADSKAMFASVYRENLAMLLRDLPSEIRDRVADMRVLSLGVAAPDVKAAIAKYARECGRKADRAFAAYSRAMRKNSGDLWERFSFHDARVVSCTKRGRNLVLSLDSSQSIADVSKVVFRGARIIEKPCRVAESVWLYEELYPTVDGYEAHAMLERADELFYLTLECDAINLS